MSRDWWVKKEAFMIGPRTRQIGDVLTMPAGLSRWASTLIAGFVFLITAVSLLPVNVANGLSMAAARHEAHVTELYFMDVAQMQLAQQVRGGTVLPLSFAIRDLEGHDVRYIYRVSLIDSRGTVVLDEGSLSLADQQSQVVTPNVTVPAGNSQGLVQVTLVGRNEVINYWLERAL
jgi:hypothetical protein